MSTLEKAIDIATRAHAGTTDRQGQPYILHPLRVMLGVEGDDAKIVAALHDVVEDTEITLDDLRQEGFGLPVIDALERVTHDEDRQSYADYVIGCKGNDLATQVKLSDLADNASLQRVLLRPDSFKKDSKRLHRYVLSYRYLTDQLSEADYRRLMKDFEK